MINHRKNFYTDISNRLAAMSDIQISNLISKTGEFKASIGGQSCVLSVDENSIFVKKLPLTDIERRPENIQSTANLFQLPPSCHYPVSTPGFGSWREIFLHRITTDWVIADKCSGFPMMYHWRVLSTNQMDTAQQKFLEKEIPHWKDFPLIRRRVEAVQEATAEIVVFLEYIPQTVFEWLGAQLRKGGNISDKALSFIDQNLILIIKFIRSQGLVHFDAHFDNILTDGKSIYFTDFGLSATKLFDLSDAEADFLNTHQDYDQCWTITGLLYCIMTHEYGRNGWELRLKEYLDNGQGNFSPFVRGMLDRYGPITDKMFEFYKNLKKSSLTQYPEKELRQLLTTNDSRI